MDTWDTGGTGEAVAPLGLAVPTLAVENGWILAVGLSDAAWRKKRMFSHCGTILLLTNGLWNLQE